MLVLSRKIGEQVLVPELGIYITILSVGTNRVQLGIEAPREIQITRPEANRRPDSYCEAGSTVFASAPVPIDTSSTLSTV